MKISWRNAEGPALLALGFGFVLAGAAGIHLVLLSPSDNPYLWNRSSVLRGMLIGYGTALLGVGFGSRVLAARGTTLFSRISLHASDVCLLIRNDLLPAMRHASEPRTSVVWLFVVLCLGIALRAYFLSQPLRYDEAYTFLNFVDGHVLGLFDYPYPNNHVLHTVAVKFSTVIAGAHPWSIRLPTFLAGIASILLMFWLARTLIVGGSGIFAALVIAVYPYMVLYSTLARGYTLLVLLTLAMAGVAARTAQAPSVAASLCLSILAALALLTIPSAAFAAAGIFLWYACLLLINGNTLKRVAYEFVIPCALVTAGLTAILYSPVFFVSNGIERIVANDYVRALPADLFTARIHAHFAATIADFSRDVPGVVRAFFAALMVVGCYGAARRRDWAVLLLLPAMLSASALLLLMKGAIPFPRTWIFLIPVAVLLASAGWEYCLQTFSAKSRRVINGGFMFVGGCYALLLVSSNAIAKYPDTGAFSEAPRIALYLKPLIKPADEVHASVPADYPTYFYLWYYGLRDFRAKENDRSAGTKYFVVKKSGYLEPNPIQERIEQPVEKLMELADAAVFRHRPAGPPNS